MTRWPVDFLNNAQKDETYVAFNKYIFILLTCNLFYVKLRSQFFLRKHSELRCLKSITVSFKRKKFLKGCSGAYMTSIFTVLRLLHERYNFTK